MKEDLFTKNLHWIALCTRYVTDVNHGHVHTNVAHYWCEVAINPHLSFSIAQAAAEAVGIAYRYGGNGHIGLSNEISVVPHAFTSLDFFDL